MVEFYELDFYGLNNLKEAENNCFFKVFAELSDTEYFKFLNQLNLVVLRKKKMQKNAKMIRMF